MCESSLWGSVWGSFRLQWDMWRHFSVRQNVQELEVGNVGVVLRCCLP